MKITFLRSSNVFETTMLMMIACEWDGKWQCERENFAVDIKSKQETFIEINLITKILGMSILIPCRQRPSHIFLRACVCHVSRICLKACITFSYWHVRFIEINCKYFLMLILARATILGTFSYLQYFTYIWIFNGTCNEIISFSPGCCNKLLFFLNLVFMIRRCSQ